MTRRAFVGKAAKWVAALAAFALIAWAASGLVSAMVHPAQALREWQVGAKDTAWAIALAILIAAAFTGLPIVAGAIGGTIVSRRPRLAGAVAGLLAQVLANLLMGAMGWGRVPHMSWLGWVITGAITLSWWAYFGSVGGAFAAAVRAGWRETRAPSAS